jgi:hypothetical protein
MLCASVTLHVATVFAWLYRFYPQKLFNKDRRDKYEHGQCWPEDCWWYHRIVSIVPLLHTMHMTYNYKWADDFNQSTKMRIIMYWIISIKTLESLPVLLLLLLLLLLLGLPLRIHIWYWWKQSKIYRRCVFNTISYRKQYESA